MNRVVNPCVIRVLPAISRFDSGVCSFPQLPLPRLLKQKRISSRPTFWSSCLLSTVFFHVVVVELSAFSRSCWLIENRFPQSCHLRVFPVAGAPQCAAKNHLIEPVLQRARTYTFSLDMASTPIVCSFNSSWPTAVNWNTLKQNVWLNIWPVHLHSPQFQFCVCLFLLAFLFDAILLST